MINQEVITIITKFKDHMTGCNYRFMTFVAVNEACNNGLLLCQFLINVLTQHVKYVKQQLTMVNDRGQQCLLEKFQWVL